MAFRPSSHYHIAASIKSFTCTYLCACACVYLTCVCVCLCACACACVCFKCVPAAPAAGAGVLACSPFSAFSFFASAALIALVLTAEGGCETYGQSISLTRIECLSTHTTYLTRMCIQRKHAQTHRHITRSRTGTHHDTR